MSAAGAFPRGTRAGAGRSVSFAVRLPRDSTAAAAARRLVRTRLARHLPVETMDDVLLVVSELATNAVLYGIGDIELRIAFDGRCVSGNVADAGSGFERAPRDRPHRRIGGYGLRLVERVARRWGVHEGTAHVWFEIPSRRSPLPAD